jgi:hypothetical protein
MVNFLLLKSYYSPVNPSSVAINKRYLPSHQTYCEPSRECEINRKKVLAGAFSEFNKLVCTCHSTSVLTKRNSWFDFSIKLQDWGKTRLNSYQNFRIPRKYGTGYGIFREALYIWYVFSVFALSCRRCTLSHLLLKSSCHFLFRKF